MQGTQLVSNSDKGYAYDIRRRRKKNGRFRTIYAPNEKLKTAQREFADWLQNHYKDKFTKNYQVTGFVPGKSIADNAKPHLNKDWVINLDVKDFFPSCGERFVSNTFSNLPKSKSLRYLLSRQKPTAYKNSRVGDLLDLTMISRNGKRELPQGSPASPVIANLIAIDYLDPMINNVMSDKLGGFAATQRAFTRYADDITISFNYRGSYKDGREIAKELVQEIEIQMTHNCHFDLKSNKTKIKHRSQQQIVTGVLVNGNNPRIERKLMNNIRAGIHNSKLDGRKVSDEIKGMMSFIQSINKAQYDKLLKQLGD
jgi:retron-type reverse transcriptase